ncbi:SRPBCC family protein [Rhodococcus sp. IEGM 1366]|uniref:SRPBCC family protein n=1 Tax=Rhodococcus sp. IEGM 1366 TaxID=3082223 RepID=UPI0029551D96|nr:SRPBCC family protein [Rhodococcus sp. IEGM 1366]MDV8071344.1 SRPBCC family protein [Rhodococcus sp. IEGM 1366]
MKLQNTINIPATPDEVFKLINDVERVATCVPGASLTGQEGDTYVGGVKVKVGPITAAYNGKLRFVSVDESTRRVVFEGKGADSHGNGDAQAHIELVVDEVPDGSQLRVDTDLILSGKIVAFGKGAIVAVSNKIMAQFASNLAALLQASSPPLRGGARPRDIDRSSSHTGPQPSVHPIRPTADMADAGLDMMSMLPPGTKKAAALAGAFVAGIIEGWLISRAFRKP